MGKKKKKSVPAKRNNVYDALSRIDGGSKVSDRVNSVIEKMTRPPETIIEHLQRVGIEPDITRFEDGKPYLVIDFEEMIKLELANIAQGGFFKDEYPTKKTFGDPARKVGEKPSMGEIFKKIGEAAEAKRRAVSDHDQGTSLSEKQLADLRQKLSGEPKRNPVRDGRSKPCGHLVGAECLCSLVKDDDDDEDGSDNAWGDDDDYPAGEVQG